MIVKDNEKDSENMRTKLKPYICLHDTAEQCQVCSISKIPWWLNNK